MIISLESFELVVNKGYLKGCNNIPHHWNNSNNQNETSVGDL